MRMAATMLRWRDMSWWRGEQALGLATGVRHPRRFHADNLERRMAGVFGNSWLLQTHDRQKWREGPGGVAERHTMSRGVVHVNLHCCASGCGAEV